MERGIYDALHILLPVGEKTEDFSHLFLYLAPQRVEAALTRFCIFLSNLVLLVQPCARILDLHSHLQSVLPVKKRFGQLGRQK